MRQFRFNAFAAILLGGFLATAGPAGAQPSSTDVDAAIKRAVEWLKGRIDANGAVGGKTGAHSQEGGHDAIVVYTLLAAGENPQDPQMKAAISHLKGLDLKGTYALGMRAQIWQYLAKNQDAREGANRDGKLLLERVRSTGDATGLFRYNAEGGDYDHSASNYGVLGIWACAQMGVEFSDKLWLAMDGAWRKHQFPDGGWCYQNGGNDDFGGKPKISMTTAGVATLFVTQEYLNPGAGLRCEGNLIDENIDRGIQWIGDNVGKGVDSNYAWYNMERVGVASGHKYFKNFDWYAKGAESLLQRQGGGDHWGGPWGEIPETCWGVLFLVHGRAPIMMNKLDYVVDTRGDNRRPPSWNERPRDLANLSRWMGEAIEREVNWQIVNLHGNERDILDAPVLYISGKEALNFTPEDEQKLKRYVEAGGLVFGNADCASAPFASSFKRIGTKLFGGEFRVLPDDHPIYVHQQYHRNNWKYRPPVFGLSNGVRELMVLVPSADPGKGWQTRAFGGQERSALAQLAANLFLYAADKTQLRYKGDTYIVTPNQTPATRTIRVARLQYPGNWDPEPGGWRRLAALLHNEKQTDLDVKAVKLGEETIDKSFAIAHLTGTTRAKLGEKMLEAMKKYVDDGGTLVIDAAGGAGDFAGTMEAALKTMFPDGKLNTLPVANPLFRHFDIKEVEYRDFTRKTLGNLKQPRLRGMEIGGRLAVIFSAEDLSAGLVGNYVDGIVGYNPTKNKSGQGWRYGATELMACAVMEAGETNSIPGGRTPDPVKTAPPADTPKKPPVRPNPAQRR
ncbi:MAG: DUF4159 domain-containing protein [Tepidisphaerales bacterium]